MLSFDCFLSSQRLKAITKEAAAIIDCRKSRKVHFVAATFSRSSAIDASEKWVCSLANRKKRSRNVRELG